MNKNKFSTDIAIIGAGITGCSIARELSKYLCNITVIEKNSDVGWATTKANSGIIHPGYAGNEGTLRLSLSHRGNVLFRKNAQELGIPIINTGSLLLVYRPNQIFELENLLKTGKKYGVKDLEIITDKERLKKLEPNLSDNVIAALFSKETCITSPYEAAIALFENAKSNGVGFLFDSEIKKIEYNKKYKKFALSSGSWDLDADVVINAAGVDSSRISEMVGDSSFEIRPVKGEYMLFDPEVGDFVNHVNYRFSEGKSKGMLVSPTTGGNFFIGPNYRDSRDEDVSVTYEGLEEVREAIEGVFNNIPYEKLITTFSGIRAVSTTEDFVLGPSKRNPYFIQAAGIQSPGLTCAFSISEIIVEGLKETGFLKKKNPKFMPIREGMKRFNKENIEKNDVLYNENDDYTEIICRCEKVSKAEIIDAIKRGAKTLDGVKFRTRAGMGRCQGGYCSLKIMKILSEELGIPFNQITKSGSSSRIAYKKIK